MSSWSFLTNYGLVLTYIGKCPDGTGLEIARAVGITERAARKIVADLLADGYIEREKVGRRNRYRTNRARPLRHPVERAVTAGELLALLLRRGEHIECAIDRRFESVKQYEPPKKSGTLGAKGMGPLAGR